MKESFLSTPNLGKAVEIIVRECEPQTVILFGSRARGDFRADSDVDLMVIKPSTEPRFKRAIPIRKALTGLMPSKDIVVYTPEEIDDWKDVPNSFVAKVLFEGKVLYEKKPS